MENVLINIGANTKEFLSGLAEVGEKTDDLGDRLKGVDTIAAAAFAGYTASIAGAVYAYREEEKVGQEVNAILQSTGGIAGVTSAAVDELADSLSKSTTFSKLQVERGEEILLTFTRIGSDVFPQATKATLDLAQRMGGDTAGAAQILGRALQDPEKGLGRLARAGILFTEQQKDQITQMELAGNMAGAQAIILKQVETQYGGMAHAAAGGTGAISQLKNASELFAAHLGSEFAPYVAAAAGKLRDLIQWASEHEAVVELTAVVLAGGAAFTGLVTALVAGSFALGQISNALGVAKLAVDAIGLSARAAMGATGVGLIAIVAYEAYENWSKLWPAAQALFHTFVTTVTQAAGGLARAVRGAFSLDLNEIKAGIAQAAQAFVDGAKQGTATVASLFKSTPEARQVATQSGAELGKTARAAQLKAEQAEEDRGRLALFRSQQASLQAELLQLQGHTKQVVDLKKQEAAILKQIAESKNATERAALQRHLAELRALEQQARTNEQKQLETFDKLKLAEGTKLSSAERQQLLSSIKTDTDARHEWQVQQLQDQITANNQFLADEARFGESYAEINRLMHNTILTQSETSLSQLSQLTQSKNSELKAAGQVASAADIEIKSAQGAMAAYAGFASIPIIGVGLGIAAAAAIELYGQERVRQVFAANQGGVVTGGIPGVDSVPALLTPGELVTPAQNYDEVVNAVARQRAGQTDTQSGPPQPLDIRITVDAKPGLARYLQVQAVADVAKGTYRGPT